MGYFIIPSEYTAGAAVTVHFDNNLQFSNIPSRRKVLFGDGYSLSIPVGPKVRNFSVSLANRETELINLVEGYFRYLEGGFVNQLNINNSVINAKVLEFQKNYGNGELYSMTANLQEVYR